MTTKERSSACWNKIAAVWAFPPCSAMACRVAFVLSLCLTVCAGFAPAAPRVRLTRARALVARMATNPSTEIEPPSAPLSRRLPPRQQTDDAVAALMQDSVHNYLSMDTPAPTKASTLKKWSPSGSVAGTPKDAVAGAALAAAFVAVAPRVANLALRCARDMPTGPLAVLVYVLACSRVCTLAKL